MNKPWCFFVLMCLAMVSCRNPGREIRAVAQESLDIRVEPDGWGSANRADISSVLVSAAEQLWPHSGRVHLDPIQVAHRDKGGPIVLFERGANNAHQVKLDTRDLYWAQYAFQFSHEVCHILCGYGEGDRSNLWFEETLCETASMFALRRMAEEWAVSPPYPTWKSFAPKLDDYVDKRLAEHRVPEKGSLASYFDRHAAYLRTHPTDRTKNTTIAARLLLIFERHPEYWAATAYLNEGRGKDKIGFSDYLLNWRNYCPKELKPAVDEVALALGVRLE